MPQTLPYAPVYLQPLWEMLEGEVERLNAKWIVYEQLFGRTAERYELLLDSAASAFALIDQSMLEDAQLTLAKLNDPATMRGFDNMTLRQMAQQVQAAGDTALYAELQPLIAKFSDACDRIKLRRNKRLAHFDLSHFLAAGSGDAPLTNASRTEVRTALEALTAVMQCVVKQHAINLTYSDAVLTGDGDALAQNLRLARRFRAMVAEGKIAAEEFVKAAGAPD